MVIRLSSRGLFDLFDVSAHPDSWKARSLLVVANQHNIADFPSADKRDAYNAIEAATNGAAGYTVSGRVITSDGRGLRNAVVSITEGPAKRTVTTSSFGFYSFDAVDTNKTYTLTVMSKRYRFSPRSVEVLENLADINFVGLE